MWAQIGRDSFFIAQGRFLTSGTILPDGRFTHVHTHAQRYQKTFLIAASIAEIGLNTSRFASPDACSVAETRERGFGSNDELIDALAASHPQFFSLDAPGTRLLCRANASTARVGGYDYDRRNTLECRHDLRFRVGEPYTILGLFGGHPGESPSPTPLADPSTYMMHLNWILAFVPPRERITAAGVRVPPTSSLFFGDVVSMMSEGADGQMLYGLDDLLRDYMHDADDGRDKMDTHKSGPMSGCNSYILGDPV